MSKSKTSKNKGMGAYLLVFIALVTVGGNLFPFYKVNESFAAFVKQVRGPLCNPRP